MKIYVVQPGDTIYSIAEAHGLSVFDIIRQNGLENPYNLVPGQTIVIAHPKQTHIVQEGDTLESITRQYNISFMELLRNNIFLMDREYIFPDEKLIIRYDTGRKIVSNGFTYPFINQKTLIKTLPYLTYLSVFNYRIDRKGEITEYEDDSSIIQLSKDFGVVPLLMLSTLTSRGEPNIEIAYDVLLNEEYLNNTIQNALVLIKEKGYSGLNIIFSYLNPSTQNLYKNLIDKASQAMRENGLLFFFTINPSTLQSSEIKDIDFTDIYQKVDGVVLMRFVWSFNTEPPVAISSFEFIMEYLRHLITFIDPDKVEIGIPMIGYEWELPYIPGKTNANSLTISSCITLAYDVSASIQFDEASQTPYFIYYKYSFGYPVQYIVWFIDARSVDAVLRAVSEYELQGSGVWNIMIFNQQLWLVVISQYEIIKLIPNKFE